VCGFGSVQAKAARERQLAKVPWRRPETSAVRWRRDMGDLSLDLPRRSRRRSASSSDRRPLSRSMTRTLRPSVMETARIPWSPRAGGPMRLPFAVPMWVSHELLSRLEARFLPSYWARGSEYHRDGRVTLVSVHDKEVRAHVRGSQRKPYLVALEQRAGDLAVDGFCSCPVGFRCKHISAVLQRLGEESAALRGDSAALAPVAALSDPALGTERAKGSGRDGVDAELPLEVAYLLEPGAKAGAAPRLLAYLVRRPSAASKDVDVVSRARFDLRRGRASAAAGPEDRR